jgi:hypothetical protein
MPLDPSIPLGVRPATFNMGDMFGAMQGMQQMRAQQQQSRIQALQLQQAEQEQADFDAINVALQQNIGPNGRPNYSAAASALEQARRGTAAQKLRTFEAAQAKAEREAINAGLDQQKKQIEVLDANGGLAFRELTKAKADPSTYPFARATVIRLMGDEVAPFLPEKYDAEVVDQRLKWWENSKSALDVRGQVLSELKSGLDVKRDARENDEHYTKILSKWLPTVGDQAEWDQAKTNALAMPGMTPEIWAKFGDTYSPEAAARARQLGLNDTRQLQAKEVMVDGQRVQANFDPQTGTYSMPGSTEVLKNVKPAPPQVDPALAEIRALTAENLRRKAAERPDLSPVKFNMANKLADDFARDSKDYVERSTSFATVQAAAKDPSPAGDLSMIFAYMKMLDPGSVVREGEFATAQNTAGVPDRIRNAYNKLINGERLAPAQRADFLKQAGNVFEGSKKRQDSIVKMYTARASTAGVPVDMVVMDYSGGLGGPSGSGSGGAVPMSGRDVTVAPGGGLPATVKMRAPDGSTSDVPADQVEHYKALGAKVIR